MSAVVQFVSTADHVLDLEEHLEERLTELVDVLVELGQRLDNLEALAVENAGAGGDPLTAILARLDAFENRLARLERHLRRPPPFPITVVENVDYQTQQRMDELSRRLAAEQHQRALTDSDLHKAQQGAMAAFNQRLDRCADQFCRMRERVAAVEAKQGDAT